MKLSILAFAFLFRPISSILGGCYVATIVSVDNRDNMPRQYADWHIAVSRKNKNKTMFIGQFELKEKIIRPEVEFKAFKLANKQFVPMAIDKITSGKISLCSRDFKKKYYDSLFEGNMGWDEQCVLTPGTMKFRKDGDLDVDSLLHRLFDVCMFNTYKVISTIVDHFGREIGGLTFVVNIRSKRC